MQRSYSIDLKLFEVISHAQRLKGGRGGALRVPRNSLSLEPAQVPFPDTRRIIKGVIFHASRHSLTILFSLFQVIRLWRIYLIYFRLDPVYTFLLPQPWLIQGFASQNFYFSFCGPLFLLREGKGSVGPFLTGAMNRNCLTLENELYNLLSLVFNL